MISYHLTIPQASLRHPQASRENHRPHHATMPRGQIVTASLAGLITGVPWNSNDRGKRVTGFRGKSYGVFGEGVTVMAIEWLLKA